MRFTAAAFDFCILSSHCHSRRYFCRIMSCREAAIKANTKVIAVLITKSSQLPELFAEIRSRSSEALCTMKIVGDTIPVAAVTIPFVAKKPMRIPMGIPIRHKSVFEV